MAPSRPILSDRFIPLRSASNFELLQLTSSPCAEEESAYVRLLRSSILGNSSNRILRYKTETKLSIPSLFPPWFESDSPKNEPARKVPEKPESYLDAPDLIDENSFNLLDWGSANVLAIALANSVYLHDVSTNSTLELVSFETTGHGPVTSVNWAPNGRHIAIGLSNCHVQVWDSGTKTKLTTLQGCHSLSVGSLAWNNNHILSTGGMDGLIVNNDVRVASHVVETYTGHDGGVCGLKWSPSGEQLASGGDDRLLYVWDRSVASSQWLHRIEDHTSTVRALAWCPFQSNLLASGGGHGDGCIKFSNTKTGACTNSVDTGSGEVFCLLWNKNKRELLSSHGLPQNHITLWKYPSMVKITQVTDRDTSRDLYMGQSPDGPDGCTVASAGDETLRFWNVFEAKPAPKHSVPPFARINCIR